MILTVCCSGDPGASQNAIRDNTRRLLSGTSDKISSMWEVVNMGIFIKNNKQPFHLCLCYII